MKLDAACVACCVFGVRYSPGCQMAAAVTCFRLFQTGLSQLLYFCHSSSLQAVERIHSENGSSVFIVFRLGRPFFFFAFTLVPFSRLLLGMYFGVLEGFVVFTRSCATISLSPSGEISCVRLGAVAYV